MAALGERVPPATVGRRDVLLAVVVGVLQCGGLLLQPQDAGLGIDRGPDALGLALAVLAAAPLAWRRTRPIGALLGCAVPLVSAAALGYGPAVAQLTLVLAVGSAALHSSRRAAVGIAAAGMVVAVLLLFALGESVEPADVLSLTGLIVLPAAIGDAIRSERRRGSEARSAAEQLRRLRQSEIDGATAAERVRIAREVHDIVGHHLSAIAVQTGAARRSLGRDPDATATALDHIRELTDRALRETRQVLGHVRGEGTPSLVPQPRLDDLDELVTDAGRQGLAVQRRVTGTPGPLDPSVQACAYRVVQEALTNVRRHGEPSATLAVDHRPGVLCIEVRNPRRPETAALTQVRHAGNGVIGMGERVALCGGRLEAGPDADEWRVRIELPAVCR